MKKTAMLLLVAAAIAVAGCNSGLDGQIKGLKKALKKPIGYSQDYFLEKNGEPVILIFGYADDLAVCMEMVKESVEKHPQNKGVFSCRVANGEE